jgi:hypothetical protein
MAPQHIFSQLVEMAQREHQLHQVLPELESAPLSEKVLTLMFTECAWQKDVDLSLRVELSLKPKQLLLQTGLEQRLGAWSSRLGFGAQTRRHGVV